MSESFFSPANINYDILTEPEFIHRKKKLQDVKNEALGELKNISKRQDEFIEKITKDWQFTELLLKKFNNDTTYDFKEKKSILKRLNRTMLITDGKVSLETDSPFIQFMEIKEKVQANLHWLELTPDNKDKDIQVFEEIKTVWSGLLTEVRTIHCDQYFFQSSSISHLSKSAIK